MAVFLGNRRFAGATSKNTFIPLGKYRKLESHALLALSVVTSAIDVSVKLALECNP